MITTSSIVNALRFPKRIIAATLLVFAFGLVSAHADFLLTDAQAKLAAAEIRFSANPYNAAVTVAQTMTGNCGAAYAAINAAKIVSFLPPNMQVLYAGRVGVGVGLNYPNQLPMIALSLGNRTNSNSGKNSSGNIAILAYQMTLAGGFDQASQIAWTMNFIMGKQKNSSSRSAVIAQVMMAAISDRPNVQILDRVNEMASISAILSIRSAGAVNPNKPEQSASSPTSTLAAIQSSLASELKIVTAGASNANELIYNALGNYALDLKKSLGPSVPQTTINALLQQAEATFQQELPGSSAAIISAINNVITNNTSTIIDTTTVVHKETPAVDGGRQP